jgi:hypothetical protein
MKASGPPRVAKGWVSALRACLCLLLALAAGGCLFTTREGTPGGKIAGGGGVETVGIRGYAYHEDGKPVSGARVLLRTREYLADSLQAGLPKPAGIISGETVTDRAGMYAIDSVEPGEYIVEVGDPDDHGALVEAYVEPASGIQMLDPAILRERGSLSGRLVQGGQAVAGAWIHIYGMQRSLASDASGRFAFGDLPEGRYRLVIRRPRPYGYTATLALSGITVEAGAARQLGNLELPAGCADYLCDSLVVRHILDRNGKDSVSVDSVALRASGANGPGRIEELDFTRLGVAVLPEIQDLTALSRLELDNNGLEALPVEVTRIVALEYLSVNNNRLTSLPREIGNLKFLTWLHLYNNNLDTLTPAVGSLTSLRYITLSYNLLRSLPAEMGRLSNLDQLFVHHNRLENLPEALMSLPKLSLIDIHSNRLCNLSARWQSFLDRGSSYDWRAYQNCP